MNTAETIYKYLDSYMAKLMQINNIKFDSRLDKIIDKINAFMVELKNKPIENNRMITSLEYKKFYEIYEEIKVYLDSKGYNTVTMIHNQYPNKSLVEMNSILFSILAVAILSAIVEDVKIKLFNIIDTYTNLFKNNYISNNLVDESKLENIYNKNEINKIINNKWKNNKNTEDFINIQVNKVLRNIKDKTDNLEFDLGDIKKRFLNYNLQLIYNMESERVINEYIYKLGNTYTEFKFIYLAVLDNKTTKLCRDRNLRIYEINEIKQEDIPPLHIGCRSSLGLYLVE